MKRKQAIIGAAITYSIISVIAGLAYNWYKTARLDYQNRHGSNIYQHFPIWDDIKLGFLLGIILYFFFLIAWIFVRRNVWLQALLTGVLTYVSIFLLVNYTVLHGRELWYAVLPLAGLGFLLPLVQKGVTIIVKRS